MRLPDLQLKDFYTYGMWIFLIVFVFNFITLKHDWFDLITSAKISQLAMLIFNLVVAWFFFTLRRSELNKQEPITEDMADEILEE